MNLRLLRITWIDGTIKYINLDQVQWLAPYDNGDKGMSHTRLHLRGNEDVYARETVEELLAGITYEISNLVIDMVTARDNWK